MENQNSKNPLLFIIPLLLLAAGAAGYYWYQKTTSSTEPIITSTTTPPPTQTLPTPTPTTITTSPTATPTATGKTTPTPTPSKIIKIQAGSYYFNPAEIRVKKGQRIKVELTAVDMMHNFVIDELKVRSAIAKAGETVTVEFTADRVGEFVYYCGVSGHRQQGQVGKLIVE